MLNNVKLRTAIAVLLVLFLISIVANAVLSLISLRNMTTELHALASQSDAFNAVARLTDQHYSNTVILAIVSTILAIALVVVTYIIITKGILGPLRSLSNHFNAIAGGDLTQRVENQSKNEIGQVFESLRQMQSTLAKTFGQIQQSVRQISGGSEDISTGNNSLSSRIDEQAAALQQTAASMEQLSGTVRQNADNAHQANQLATTASTVAQRGGEVVGEVVNTMHEISNSSSKIAEIVGVIDSIAFQTNILALNAAVEAARAGEQGRGFAVVASEVRALAQRSAQAAREITDLIEDSGQKVKEGSGQVERAGATMHEIVDSVKRVTDIMGEISAATIEQSSGIDQINMAVNQLDSTTLQNAEMVTQSAKAAADMNHQVQQLNQILSGFRADANVIDTTARHVPHQPRKVSAATRKVASSATTISAAKPRAALGGTNKPTTAPARSTPKTAAHNKSRKTTTAASSPTAASRKKAADIPGMNVTSSGGKDAPLLRPDLSSKKPTTSAEDDWVEF